MKKLVVLFLLMFSTASFASGIDANATDASCDNTTLETYSGTANVEINWIPNTIQTRWYDGNTLIDTTNTNAGSCEYDDVLNRPTNPTRTGYTFTGWTVRPEIDFSTLPTNEMGTESYGRGKYGYLGCYKETLGAGEQDFCKTEDFITGFSDLNDFEWKTIFSWGTLYGMSMCSSTSGTNGEIGNPVELADGLHCWCKSTGYIPHGTNTKYAPISAGWVYQSSCLNGETGRSLCKWVCALRCSSYITTRRNYQNQLNGLLGVE